MPCLYIPIIISIRAVQQAPIVSLPQTGVIIIPVPEAEFGGRSELLAEVQFITFSLIEIPPCFPKNSLRYEMLRVGDQFPIVCIGHPVDVYPYG